MYLTSKNLFVVVYCCIFAPLKRILLRGESPQTIILPQKEKEASRLRQLFLAKKTPVWLRTGFTPSDNLFTSKRKRGESPQTTISSKKNARTASYWLHTPLTTIF